MTHKAYTSISECLSEWDVLLPAAHHLKSFHLLPVERCGMEDVSFRYVILSNEKNETVAIAYFQWLRFLAKHYSFPVMKNHVLQKLESRVMKRGFGILSCGNMLRVDAPGIYYDPHYTTASSVFGELEQFFRTLNPYPHAILIKDWNRQWDLKWVERFRFQPWSTDLTMKLDVNPSWKSFDDYVKSLRHRYAQRVRKARKMIEPLIRRELSSNDIEEQAGLLTSLYMEVVKRQSIRLIIVNERYFVEMKKAYGSRFHVFAYFMESNLVGFSSSLEQGDIWELQYIGMDYTQNEKHWLYFNILFDSIADSIESVKKELELGRTAREAKSSLGAYPVYFINFIRINGIIPRTLIKILGDVFSKRAGKTWESKLPFRK